MKTLSAISFGTILITGCVSQEAQNFESSPLLDSRLRESGEICKACDTHAFKPATGGEIAKATIGGLGLLLLYGMTYGDTYYTKIEFSDGTTRRVRTWVSPDGRRSNVKISK